jgi:hypothetical protein
MPSVEVAAASELVATAAKGPSGAGGIALSLIEISNVSAADAVFVTFIALTTVAEPEGVV